MTRADLSKYPVGTPEYVVTHARYQKSRGRKPSATFYSLHNPLKALKMAELLAYFPPTINVEGAKKVAEIFRRIKEVRAVEVFGSVARGEEGNDLDLILICDGWTSETFMMMVETEIKSSGLLPDWYHGCALTRNNIAQIVLQGTYQDTPFEDAEAECPVKIDVFIFPPNWRERLEELQGRMEHDDPQFMAKIAKDARRIA